MSGWPILTHLGRASLVDRPVEPHHVDAELREASSEVPLRVRVEVPERGAGVGRPESDRLSRAEDKVVPSCANPATLSRERLDKSQPAGDVAGFSMGAAIDTSAAQLRATVTSPGGTTAAGLRELERGGLRAAVANAVGAAQRRSEQLGITFE